MARTVTLSGQTYTIPEQGDVGWGSLTDLIERLTNDVNTLNSSTLATPTPLRRRVREVTSSPTTLLSTDDVVLVNIAAISSINLPDVTTIDPGKVITIKDLSGAALTNTISVFGFGGSLIDGLSQYDINDSYGDASFVLNSDGTSWSRIQSLDEKYEHGLMPIGTIFAITSHLAGSWTLPLSGAVKKGLMLCDGSAIPAGQTLSGSTPNLSDNRFLMGATTSGTSGAATDLTHTHDYTHTHTTDSQLTTVDFSHDHTGSTGADSATFTGTLSTSGGAASFNKNVMNTNQNSHTHQYGIQNFILNADFAYITGSESLGIRNYNSGGFAGWNYSSSVGTYGARAVNSNSGSGTKNVTPVLKESTASTSWSTATWNSTTVNTTFTQPTLASADLNSNQTAHTHTIASDLGSVDLSHSHTTNSQSLTDTGSALSGLVDLRPRYFEAIYLIRVD